MTHGIEIITACESVPSALRGESETAEAVTVRFEVEDTGVGIAPEVIARLFSAFEQADSTTTRTHGGTGPGLAITKKIAELMGGTAGVASAVGGRQGVEMACDGNYALVLMDMQMPVLDGLGATREIRRCPQCKDLPIVAMTANAFAQDRARCLAAGMDDFIAKPVSHEVLYETLYRHLPRGGASER